MAKKQNAYLKIKDGEMYWEFVGLNGEFVRRFGKVDFEQLHNDLKKIEANMLIKEVLE